MRDDVLLWLHVVAATAFVGPQIFLTLVVPGLRLLPPEGRVLALRVLTSRFGWLGWGAVVVLVLTGIENLRHAASEGVLIFDPEFRYLWIFVAKMALLAVALAAVAVHSFLVGPRQLRLMEAALRGGDPLEERRVRRATVLLGMVGLLASLGILLAAVLLHDYSFSNRPL
jgi:uncharacterized membrane protein